MQPVCNKKAIKSKILLYTYIDVCVFQKLGKLSQSRSLLINSLCLLRSEMT